MSDIAKFNDMDITIKSFRDLSDEELEHASLSLLPDHTIEPAELRGKHYLSLAKRYPQTAFLIPGGLIYQLKEEAMQIVKQAARNAVDEIWFE